MINKHKSNKIKENSNTVRHLNNGTDHRHSKSCCDQSSPARRTITLDIPGSPIDSQWGYLQLCTRSALLLIVPIHNKFSHSDEQSEQRKLAHTL